MTAICPNGHPSSTADYCDQCGAPILRVSVGEQTEVLPVIDDADTSAATPAELCPECQTPRHADDRYCELDGYDFVGGRARGGGARGADSAAPGFATGTPVWEAVVRADQAQFERFGADVTFPDSWPEQIYVLAADRIRIGRGGEATGQDQPEIDLGGPLEDPGISRRHAVLERLADGTFAVRDLGSTNGTSVNDDPLPLSGDQMVRLSDRDRIRLGAWTVIEIRVRRSLRG